MTPEQAQIWNAAIKAAASKYPEGVGAIKSLTKSFTVTVAHIGTTTKQEVTVEEENG